MGRKTPKGRGQQPPADADGAWEPMPPELAEDLRAQRERFKAKFGREPGPKDPIFFDPNADEPRPYKMSEEEFASIISDCTAAGMPVEVAFAWWKTGRLVTEANAHLIDEEGLDQWEEAIEEFRSMMESGEVPPMFNVYR